MSHVNSSGRVGALLGLTDPAAGGRGDLANGGTTTTSTSVPDRVRCSGLMNVLLRRALGSSLAKVSSAPKAAAHCAGCLIASGSFPVLL